MAEQTTESAEPTDAAVAVDPGERGTLTVTDRAVEHIAAASLGRTTGVVTASSGFGRKPSRVKVTKDGDRVRAAVDTTVGWPLSAAAVADELRRDIARGMTDSGLRPDSVDVRVSDFGGDESSPKNAVAPTTGTPAASPRPLAAPAATPLAVLFSLLLLTGAGVLIRDGLVGLSAVTGTTWTPGALDALDGLTPQSWMFPVGIAVAVVGVLVVLASLKWRARRYKPSEIADEVWLRKSDLKKLQAVPDHKVPESKVPDSEVSDSTVPDSAPSTTTTDTEEAR